MENRSEKRSTNCKNQTQDRTGDQSTNRTTNSSQNSATNEHKHPNQYTKGADDESAKNSTSSRSKQRQKQPLTLPFAPDGPRARTSDLSQIAKPAALRHCFPVRKAAGFRVRSCFYSQGAPNGRGFLPPDKAVFRSNPDGLQEEQRSMAAKRPFRRCAMIMKATSQVSLGSNCCHSVSNSSCTRLS